MGQVRIWWDPTIQAYQLSSSYSKELVDGLKAFIPVSDRSFDPNTKIWTITERFLSPVQMMLTKLKMQATVITRQQAEAASQSSPAKTRGIPLEDALMRFCKLMPYDAIRKGYLVASMSMHPDKGGNMDTYTEFNSLWQRLEKELWMVNK